MAESGGHWVKKAGGNGPGGTVFVPPEKTVQQVAQKAGENDAAGKISARIREIDAERKDLYQGRGPLVANGKTYRREGKSFRDYQRKRYSELMREREKLLSARG